jgi:hypothetical protein
MKSRGRHQVLGRKHTHSGTLGAGGEVWSAYIYIYIIYIHIIHISYTYVQDYTYYTLSAYAYIYIIPRYTITHTRW